MKEDRFLHRVWRTFMSMLVMVCLCGLTFTACVDDESIVDPIYAVDLGLSVKWAWCNVGAERPEQEGNLYAWGETQVKSDYSPSNYEHNAEYTYIGTDICGTAYDAAQLAMGDGWRMPTREEIIELVSRCTWEKANLKGRDGVFVTGPNGNRIFLPNVSKGYWSGALASMDNFYPERSHSLSWAHSLPWLNGKAVSFKLGESYCYTGLAIRPVKTSDEVYNDGIGNEVVSSSVTYTVNGVSFTMIGVEGGTFTMGSPDSDTDAEDNEKPAHQVKLSSYYIGETEVTQALWQAVMGSNPSEFKGDLQCPVEQVTWNDCQSFINKLNKLTGKNFRLPTEAEWEYAARGGRESKNYKYSGSNSIADVAWYGKNSSDKTHPVKTKQPNELGIYDMSGNVVEWCSDWYGSYPLSLQTNPTGPSVGSDRVIRWGSWAAGSADVCRVASRSHIYPHYKSSVSGLRLALSSTEGDDEPEQEFITITTSEATNITSEGATLSGVVSGTTDAISCGIIYGTASNITSLNNKRVGAYYNGAYSIDVSYLQPGTTYYYCAYAVIGGEELYGEVREFTTQSITITTGEATNITPEGATLSGVVSGTTDEISCGIIYGTASNITSLNNKRVGAYYNGAYSIDVSYLQPGTTYYYCAYAVIGGEELYGEVREFTTNILIDGFEAVDLGLSVKWATHNVGAESPEDYGDYFAWGETTTKSSYAESNSVTHGLSDSELITLGIIDANGNLTVAYDAATANWGDKWRIPTLNEIQELINNCTWKWTVMNDVNGYEVTGTNGNSIFLPTAGYRRNNMSPFFKDLYGYYSSATISMDGVYCLHFRSDIYEWNNFDNRAYGLVVRPILK